MMVAMDILTFASQKGGMSKITLAAHLAQDILVEALKAYHAIREDAAIDTDLPLATLPGACAWTVKQVLDADFWTEASSMS
jgi:hypothetical protein